MNDLLRRIKAQLVRVNARLSAPQKASVLALLLLLVAGFGTLVWYSSQPTWRTFRAGLTDEEQGEIRTWLAENRIPYDLGPGVVRVPDEMYHDVRAQMAAAGIGAGGADPLLSVEFGDPKEVVDRRLLLATEQDLARTLSAMEEVKSARVHIAKAAPELFARDQKPPRASVVLYLRRGTHLSKKRVDGIVSLVTGAVAGLEPENVNVVDGDGEPLKAVGDETSMIAGTMLEFQRSVEQSLEEKASKVLREFVGEGEFRVAINANIDMSEAEEQREVFDPQTPVARTEVVATKLHENGPTNVGGRAGAVNNEGGGGTRAVGQPYRANEERTTTNYEISKKTTRVKGPGVKLAGLSVAVVIDGTYETPPPPVSGEKVEEGAPPLEPVYKARTPEELLVISKLVSQAVGLDEARGDRIEVSNRQFRIRDEQPVEDLLAADARRSTIEKAVKYGLVLVIALLLVFVVFRPMVRWLTEPSETAELIDDGALPPGEVAALPGEADLALIDQDDGNVLEHIRRIAREDPELAASVLRFWLKDAEV